MTITLVLGGARSGKSMYAQREAEKRASVDSGELVMVATGEPFDREMEERIKLHQAERGPAWRTVEVPLELPRALSKLATSDITVVDCLTLWVSNLLMREKDVRASGDDLIAALDTGPRSLWLVSNEVGMGIVPENALARKFRDECGRLHQKLAARADHVFMIVAGLPLRVK